MHKLLKFLSKLTTISKWTGISAIIIMMFFITIGVILRRLGSPLLGSVEIVQLLMVVAIMGGLSYCESKDGHIAVDLVYERVNPKFQKVLRIFSKVISLGVVSLVAFVFYQVALDSITSGSKTTDLIGIPFYPFEVIISIGFAAWFIQILGSIFIPINQVEEDENVQ